VYGYESSATLTTQTNYRPVLSSERVDTCLLIPASRKRRLKGNPVVSGETVTYGYESSATLTTQTKYRPVLSSERVEYFHRSPASHKRRWKGNPVFSGDTVTYGYESSATLTIDRLHDKLQTRPLVREGRILPA
jgi:hypothetical protein